jgi:hypothetical protein
LFANRLLWLSGQFIVLDGLLEVSGYHDHQAVTAKAALEWSIETLGRHQILKNNKDGIEIWNDLQPTLHKFGRHAAQMAIVGLFSLDCYVDFNERSDLLFQIKRLPDGM